jgi:hypothetical protein
MHNSFVHAEGYATSDYKACQGEGDNGIFFKRSDGLNAKLYGQEKHYTRTRPADVTDGLSKTIALGESSYYTFVELGSATYNYDWPIWMGGYGNGTDEAVQFKTDAKAPINCLISPKMLQGLKNAVDDDCAFSWHDSGAFFVFADGSVHFLFETIDMDTYRFLGTKNDGNIIADY